jgi:lipopolysaccharide/colanic/teichoic acid biosynthesis glycosyltransferase
VVSSQAIEGDDLRRMSGALGSAGLKREVARAPTEVAGPRSVHLTDGPTRLRVEESRIAGPRRPVKHRYDLSSATVGLAVLTPLMAVAAVAVKVDATCAVFLRQVRVGKPVERPTPSKLRTVAAAEDRQRVEVERPNQGDGPRFGTRQEPCVRRLAGFIRLTLIDDIRQPWIGLLGHMSSSEPRPHLLSETVELGSDFRPWMLGKSGVCGLATGQRAVRRRLRRVGRYDSRISRTDSLTLNVLVIRKKRSVVFPHRGVS